MPSDITVVTSHPCSSHKSSQVKSNRVTSQVKSLLYFSSQVKSSHIIVQVKSSQVIFSFKTLCVCVSLLESLVRTQVPRWLESTCSRVKVISQVTRVKSSHLGEISSQVKSSKKLWLESTRVRVSDLTCYNTVWYMQDNIVNSMKINWNVYKLNTINRFLAKHLLCLVCIHNTVVL